MTISKWPISIFEGVKNYAAVEILCLVSLCFRGQRACGFILNLVLHGHLLNTSHTKTSMTNTLNTHIQTAFEESCPLRCPCINLWAWLSLLLTYPLQCGCRKKIALAACAAHTSSCLGNQFQFSKAEALSNIIEICFLSAKTGHKLITFFLQKILIFYRSCTVRTVKLYALHLIFKEFEGGFDWGGKRKYCTDCPACLKCWLQY